MMKGIREGARARIEDAVFARGGEDPEVVTAAGSR